MSIDELKTWARETGNTGLVAELTACGWELREALEHVYDMKTLSKDEFFNKYFAVREEEQP